MALSLADYRQFVANSREPTDRKVMAMSAIDAYERLDNSPIVKPDELQPIVEAAKSRFRMVWDIGMDFLVRLAETHQSAQQAMLEMLNASKVQERFQVVASLREGLPKPLCLQIIEQGLNDRGNRVREKAAEAADRLNLREVAPYLRQRLDVEDHPNAKESLQFHLAMLTDGYILKPRDDHRYDLTFRTKRGGWCSVTIPESQAKPEEIQGIIVERDSKPY